MWLSCDEYSEIPSQGRSKECLPLLSRSPWLTKARFYLGNQPVYFCLHRWGVTCGVGAPLAKGWHQKVFTHLGWGLPLSQSYIQTGVLWPPPSWQAQLGWSFCKWGQLVGSGLCTEVSEVEDGCLLKDYVFQTRRWVCWPARSLLL